LVPAWLLVVVVIGALPHGDFHGILGVQHHELRLVAFSITGGVGYA
jgi:rRNA pseudouridine-1189 N-methylase Emg1 (Nep1/Mra1 family)